MKKIFLFSLALSFACNNFYKLSAMEDPQKQNPEQKQKILSQEEPKANKQEEARNQEGQAIIKIMKEAMQRALQEAIEREKQKSIRKGTLPDGITIQDYYKLIIAEEKKQEDIINQINREKSTLKNLNLSGRPQIEKLELIDFPELQELTLNKNCKTLIIENCPKLTSINIEDLSQLKKLVIKDCPNLSYVNMDSIKFSINSIEITDCPEITGIELNDFINLTEFKLNNIFTKYLNISKCPNLIILDLSDSSNIPTAFIEQMINENPQLTMLWLRNCKQLKNLEIINPNLTFIDLGLCINLEKLNINCPLLIQIILGNCVSLENPIIKCLSLKKITIKMPHTLFKETPMEINGINTEKIPHFFDEKLNIIHF